MSNAFSDWDLDFSKGKYGEDLVVDVMSGTHVEVKTDYQWQRTGNIYIEFSCYNNTQGKFIPSGIDTTKADWQSYVLIKDGKHPSIVTFPTSLIKRVVKDCSIAEMNNGANPSKGYLMKLSQVYGYMLNAAA